MSHTHRFRDDGLFLGHFATRFLVRCPRCAKQAVVTRTDSDGAWVAKASCFHCGYTRHQSFDPLRWHGPVWIRGYHRCGYCGRDVFAPPRALPKPPTKREDAVRCPGCNHITIVPVSWSPAPPSQPYDRFFGLPLWLQVTVL